MTESGSGPERGSQFFANQETQEGQKSERLFIKRIGAVMEWLEKMKASYKDYAMAKDRYRNSRRGGQEHENAAADLIKQRREFYDAWMSTRTRHHTKNQLLLTEDERRSFINQVRKMEKQPTINDIPDFEILLFPKERLDVTEKQLNDPDYELPIDFLKYYFAASRLLSAATQAQILKK